MEVMAKIDKTIHRKCIKGVKKSKGDGSGRLYAVYGSIRESNVILCVN
jgi:hypothetical protein